MASLLKSNTTALNELLAKAQALPAALDTSDATATASDMLAGETAYVNGEKVTGNIQSQAATTITPSETTQTAVAANMYTTGAVVVAPIPADYENVSTSLTALNKANGGTAATSVAAAAENTETLTGEQAELIGQIQTALEGKTAGSGGGAVETCSVTIHGNNIIASYLSYIDGEYSIAEDGDTLGGANMTVIIENVVCNSLIYIVIGGATVMQKLTVNSGNFRFNTSQAGYYGSHYYQLLVPTDSAGGIVTLAPDTSGF